MVNSLLIERSGSLFEFHGVSSWFFDFIGHVRKAWRAWMVMADDVAWLTSRRFGFLGWMSWFSCWFSFLGWMSWFSCWFSFLGWMGWFSCWFSFLGWVGI